MSEHIQHLHDQKCDVCDACQSRVYFVTIDTKPLTPPTPQYRVAYLRCPVCGAHATRLYEVSSHKIPAVKPRKPRYVYRKRARAQP